jgi:hypothetical protein
VPFEQEQPSVVQFLIIEQLPHLLATIVTTHIVLLDNNGMQLLNANPSALVGLHSSAWYLSLEVLGQRS